MHLIITDTAREDLRNIRRHIVKNNPKAAKVFMKDLLDKLHNLAVNGVIGSSRESISPELRAFPYRGRCFYFCVVGDKMFVLRVLHGSQDIEKQKFQRSTEKYFH